VVPITHEQTIIRSKTRLDGTTHEQTIICWQLFAGHVVGCRPMEGKKKLHRMIKCIGVSIYHIDNGSSKIFDACGRDEYGRSHLSGICLLFI